MARFTPLLVSMVLIAAIGHASSRTLMQAAGASCTTVYGQIATNPDLKTLKVAVDAAGLQATLSDRELVATIFAPSDYGFQRLASDGGTTVAALLAAPPAVLKQILSYHVIPGRAIEASDLKTGLRFDTLAGDAILVESQKIKSDQKYAGCGGLDIHLDTYIDEDPEPNVCDIKACKALVHIVDYVLIPNQPSLQQILPQGRFKTQLSG